MKKYINKPMKKIKNIKLYLKGLLIRKLYYSYNFNFINIYIYNYIILNI